MGDEPLCGPSGWVGCSTFGVGSASSGQPGMPRAIPAAGQSVWSPLVPPSNATGERPPPGSTVARSKAIQTGSQPRAEPRGGGSPRPSGSTGCHRDHHQESVRAAGQTKSLGRKRTQRTQSLNLRSLRSLCSFAATIVIRDLRGSMRPDVRILVPMGDQPRANHLVGWDAAPSVSARQGQSSPGWPGQSPRRDIRGGGFLFHRRTPSSATAEARRGTCPTGGT